MTHAAARPTATSHDRDDRSRRKSTRAITLTIDGQAVAVPEGTTIYNACRSIGIEIPTLCFLDTLHPVNVCRVCVVEVEGSRVLVPSCSRAVEDKMVVQHQLRAREAQPQARARDAGVVRRSVDDAARRRVDRRVRCQAGAFRTAGAARAVGHARRVDRRAITRRRIPRTPRPSPSRRRSTTSCTCATTRSASSATSASKRAARIIRTRSRSRSPDAGSMHTSRPSSPFRFPNRRACTAETALPSVRPAH